MSPEIHSWLQTGVFVGSILVGLGKFAYKMSKHFDTLCVTVDRLDKTVSRLESTIGTHAEILPDQERRIAILEGRVQAIEVMTLK